MPGWRNICDAEWEMGIENQFSGADGHHAWRVAGWNWAVLRRGDDIILRPWTCGTCVAKMGWDGSTDQDIVVGEVGERRRS